MRLLPIFLLIFSCLTWGGVLPKENFDIQSEATLPSETNRFIWPTQGRIINGFDSSSKGIDIAGKAGQPVVAAGDGKVLYAKNMRGYGNLIIVEHSGGMVTAYAHNKTILVREGQMVNQGQQIGEMGDSDADTVKLRFQVRLMGKPVDPMTLLPISAQDPLIERNPSTNYVGGFCDFYINKTVKSNINFPDLHGVGVVTVVIRLSTNRSLKEVKVVVPSKNPAFDQAVERGIRKTALFPRECPEDFEYSFAKDEVIKPGVIFWKASLQISQERTLAGLGSALSQEISKEEAALRSLPRSLADRQSRLEQEKPTKDEYESIAQFNQRVAKWNAAAEKLNADIQAHYAKLGPLSLDKRTQAFERALSRAYGNPELHDVRYDPETARFFATLKASLDPEFKRLVSIPVPNDQARAVKAKLTSAENGFEVELRVTDQNELIWGQPRIRLNGEIVVADYIDKDFVPPVTTAIASDPQLKTILPPPIATLPSSPDVKVIDDPNINKLQMEVLQKEREQAALAARQSEEKRLKERLAELNRQTKPEFEDDLPKLLAKVPASKSNPKLHVLAIGINDYADVPDVPFADRSAQQFAEIAKKLLGAEPQNVIVLTDSQATLGRLLGRLNTLLNRLGPEDQLLFYYAGHGVPAKDGSGAFLLAQDGGSGSYEQLPLQLVHLYKAIAKSKVGQAKIFIDACFSGRSGKDTIVFEGIAPVVPKVDQSFPDSQRLAVVTAGRGDQFSNQDKARGHRLFSYHLMRLLLEDGAKLEIAQLHKRLRDVVLNESRRIGPEFEQEPDLQGNGRMVVLDLN